MFLEQRQSGFSQRAPALAVGVLLFTLAPVKLPAETPTIKSILPLAAAPGKTTEVVIEGQRLAGVTGLWTTFESKISIVEAGKREESRLRLRIDIPEKTPVGIGAIRAAGPGGLSNLELFLIDDLPASTPGAKNTSAENAAAIEPPCAIDSRTTTDHRDYYSFRARAGQRLSFEVMAQRIGSRLDPILRILDSAGREVAFSDDSAGADSRLAWRCEQEGEYLIELRDVIYRGGDGFTYRLRAGDFPLVSAPYPMRAEQEKSTKISIAGPDCAGVESRNVQLPGGSSGRAFSLGARFPGGASSSFVTLLSSDLPELLEKEPNNRAESAGTLQPPCAINGRFANGGDRDFYQIAGKKGTRLVIRGETRHSGSPTDLYLRLEKPGGGKIAEAEDRSYDPGKDKEKGKNYYFEEGVLNYTFPEDGRVILMVEDLIRRGGPEHVYRIEVRHGQGDFSLELEETLYSSAPGGDLKVKVRCRRNGYDGPIELVAEGLPGGTKPGKARIGKGTDSAELKITLEKDLQPGSMGTFRIFGTPADGGRARRIEARTREALRKTFPRLFHPPRILDGLAAFAVTEAKK